MVARFGRDGVKQQLRSHLDALRLSSHSAMFSMESVARSVESGLGESLVIPLQRVINGTGILIHTNLGRSPIDPAAWQSGGELATRYSNLEFDLERGDRGARDGHISGLASRLFGCEAAILVNNNAGAVLLLLAAIAARRDVIVSRGELVEIGGSFRVPDVIAQGGARLVEVGTTNRTRRRDYEKALTRRTGAVLKVHRSNFALVGFTESASVAELVEVGRARKVPVVMDEGSGRVVDLSKYGFAKTATVRELIESGVDAVTCSTDKLLGSLQGGLILGRREIVSKCAAHPLMRALRAGKESYGTLAATLRSFLTGKYEEEIPIYRMLATPIASLRLRAEALASKMKARVVETRSALGGGTTPTESIPSIALAFSGNPDRLAESLRRNDPPVIGRIEQGRFLLDLRTIFPSDDEVILRPLSS